MKHLLLPICLLTLLCSCREDRDELQLLDSIEETWQLSETALPEACICAEGLRDSVAKSSEYVRQKYNLLTIRLRDKRDMIPSSPDSAMQVLTYFERGKDNRDKERAYYYLSSAYRDLKDYPRAIAYSLKAVEAARQCQRADTMIWQNSLSKMRYLYMLLLNYEEELNVALESVELAKQSGKNLGWYLTDAATAYKHLNDTLRCLQYCDQAYQAIREEHFPAKYGQVLANMLATYAKYGRYDKVDTLLHQLSELPVELRPQNYELCLAMYHENANETDSAILHYHAYYDGEKTIAGRYEAAAGLQRCYHQRGNMPLAAEWGCRLYDTNDSIIAQRAFEETQRARDSYAYYRNREKEQAIVQRDERITFAFVTSALVLLSIILGLLAFYNYRKRKFLEKISSMGRELKNRKDINRELTKKVMIDTTEEGARSIIEEFRKACVGQTRLEEKAWKELMGAIEALYPGFHEAVQERLGRHLHEPLLRTICLMKTGMNPAQIAKVMGTSPQTAWNRVHRARTTCGDLIESPKPQAAQP